MPRSKQFQETLIGIQQPVPDNQSVSSTPSEIPQLVPNQSAGSKPSEIPQPALNNQSTADTPKNDKKTILILGDSTLDNRIWIGLAKTELNFDKDSILGSVLRFLNDFNFLKPLSVVENLRFQLPGFNFVDHTNDGFTTKDILNGCYRDKVFYPAQHRFFPHELFKPLETRAVEDASQIILSIGGNNFREFIQNALKIISQAERKKYIQENYPKVLKEAKEEYQKILKNLVARNPTAKIILMTQYYPAVHQKTFLDTSIYDFMSQLGEVLQTGDAQDTLVHVMKEMYNDVLQVIDEDSQLKTRNIAMVDVTSSLNPNITKDFVGQIEPSGSGGQKIAQMLSSVIQEPVNSRTLYRFSPEYFSSNKACHIYTKEIDKNTRFVPLHPKEMPKSEYDMPETQALKKIYEFKEMALRNTENPNVANSASKPATTQQAGETAPPSMPNTHQVPVESQNTQTQPVNQSNSSNLNKTEYSWMRIAFILAMAFIAGGGAYYYGYQLIEVAAIAILGSIVGELLTWPSSTQELKPSNTLTQTPPTPTPSAPSQTPLGHKVDKTWLPSLSPTVPKNELQKAQTGQPVVDEPQNRGIRLP